LILLDTNVLSELMRPKPESIVVRWVDGRQECDVWISAITVAEIRLGIELLPNGKRKSLLISMADHMFHEEFAGRCLPFDYEAACKYSQIVADRSRKGKPISVEDAQIAAIAITADLSLATRNIKDFEGIEELNVINPWFDEIASFKGGKLQP